MSVESKLREEEMKSFLSPRLPAPIFHSKEELKKFIISLVNFCEKNEFLDSEIDASASLRNKLFIDIVVKTARGLQTHNTKIPDANRALPGPFYRTAKSEDIGYVYSGSTELRRKLFWAGNAAELGKKHFLTTQFFFKNKLTSIAEEFYFKIKDDLNSDAIEILSELGMSEEDKGLIKNAVIKALDHNPTVAIDPQIFWPIENGEYICITPIVSCGMQRRILEGTAPYQEGMFREFDSISVAGSNPGNAGDLSSSIVGKFKLLKAKIPKYGDNSKDHIWKIIFSKGTTFDFKPLLEITFFKYLVPLEEDGKYHFTFENKKFLEKKIDLFLDECFEKTFKLYDLINKKNQLIPDWVQKKMDSSEINFYFDIDHKKIAHFSRFCFLNLKKNINKEKDFIDDELEKCISNAFSYYLSGILL